MLSVYRNLDCQRMVRDWCIRRIDSWDAAHERWEISTAAGPTSVVAVGTDLARSTTTRTRRLLRHMVAPDNQVPDELTEWMTLVARCCRSSLDPMPLPPETLAARRASTTLVAIGRHDVFLPPNRIGPAIRHHLGIGVRLLDGSGHLILDEQPGTVVELVDEVLGAL